MNIRISQPTEPVSTTEKESLVPTALLLEFAREETHVSTTASALRSWQIRTTLRTGIVGPPIASFVLLPWVLFSTSATSFHLFDLASYPGIFLFFAIPVGYVFGVIPALLAGAMYSAALTEMPSLRSHTLLRVCVGVVSGGLCGGLWFHAVIGTEWPAYGLAAALVMGVLALRWPESPTSSDLRYRAEGDCS